MFNDQTLADNANFTPPFGGAASWAMKIDGPVQGMNFGQSQAMSMNAQPGQQGSGFFPPQGFPQTQQPQQPLQPQQPQPDNGFPPPWPPSQSYPQVQPNSGFPPGPMFPPPQNYPPQQGFPPAQPNGASSLQSMENTRMPRDYRRFTPSARTVCSRQA